MQKHFLRKHLIEFYLKEVDFVELDKVCKIKNGYTPSKSTLEYWNGGEIPWFRMDDIRINGNILNDSLLHIPRSAVKGESLFPANSILVATSATIGVHALIMVPHLSNQRFVSLSLKPEYGDKLDMKFVYYYCDLLDEWCVNNTTKSSFSSVDMPGFKKFKIPIPPLSIQQEIVRILNSFTELATELETELEKRQEQYEYYRTELLTFDNLSGKIQRFTLGELGTIITGRTPSSSDSDFWGDELHFITPSDIKSEGKYIFAPVRSLSKKGASAMKSNIIPANSILVTCIGSDMGKTVMNVADCVTNQQINAIILKDGFLAGYIYHKLSSMYSYLKSFGAANGATMPIINKSNFSKIEIDIPSLSEQQRIVTILDKFESLVNDISIGLPAEIKARHKQYEYYRNQLLTFKEKTNE